MKLSKLFWSGVLGTLFFSYPLAARAHCPLCTAGAGLVAIGAYWAGVNGLTIGLWLGAFAMALGLWIARLVKRKYFRFQYMAIWAFSWATTLPPLKMLLSDYTSIYINWGGDYGSLFNRTYPINLFLIGGVLGAVIIHVSPSLSKLISAYRGRTLPYQGIVITFILLLFVSLITQFIL